MSSTYLFVVCPNNSGSTLIARIFSSSPSVSAFDCERHEGQWLVSHMDPSPMPYPTGDEVRNWTTAREKYSDPANYRWDELMRVWNRHWDRSKPILLEKTPSTVVSAPLFQEHFRPASFIVSIRNPYAVVEGIRRRSGHPLRVGARHWVRCAELQIRNLSRLRRALFFRYEDLCAAPRLIRSKLLDFLPQLGAVDIEARFDVGSLASNISNQNDVAMAELSDSDFEEINSVLDRSPQLLARFGYRRVGGREIAIKIARAC